MITVQNTVRARHVPTPSRLRKYLREVLGAAPCEVTVRIVGSRESQALNRTYRGKDQPTNVLSFPYQRRPLQGDIFLCAPLVWREAREQRKPPAAHWAHLVVHGALHLRGYDHIKHRDAKRMEARERAILSRFRIPDPYQIFPVKSH